MLLLAHLLGLVDLLGRVSNVLLELHNLRLVRPETSFQLEDVLAELLDQELRVLDRCGLASGRLLAPARIFVIHRLLRGPVSDDLCTKTFDQLDDTVDRGLRARSCRGRYEEEGNDAHSRCGFVRTLLSNL